MAGDAQVRRRKDKRKKKDGSDDEGSHDEELKDHSAGGSSCLSVIVFLLLLSGIGVLVGLIYVQTKGLQHVETPVQESRFASVFQGIVEETVTVEEQQPLVQEPGADSHHDAAEEGDEEETAGSEEPVTVSQPQESEDEGVEVTDEADAAEPTVVEPEEVRSAEEPAESVLEPVVEQDVQGDPATTGKEVEEEEVQPQAAEVVESQPEPANETPLPETVEIKPEAETETESKTKTEPEAETKPDTESETKAESKTDSKAAESKVGSKTDSKTETKVESEAGRKADVEAEADDGVEVDEGIEADEEPYDKADITGSEDWKIRRELDAADDLIETDAAAALNAFGAILTHQPRSPRALYGRARALNAQAQTEQSNNKLDRAISAFKEVLMLDLERPIPPTLYRRAGESCAQLMRFRGQYDKAARVQQQMIQKFPDDYMLRNHLASVFMTLGQNRAAEEVLQEVLKRWPGNGYAQVHLGFIRKQEGSTEEGARLLQAGLDTDEPGVQDGRFYYHLGDAYTRLGQHHKAKLVYEEAVKRGMLRSVDQRSLYNVDRLKSRPFWTKEQTGSEKLIEDLESNWEVIRDEMLALLKSDRPEDGFIPEQEDLSKSGQWKQFKLYGRGRRSGYACAKLPKTCDLIAKYPEAATCRRGQVKFSMLAGGTSVWPHTGPTNCRLRLHLGLVVPDGAKIRVANETRTWQEGKVLVIDDSFEHEVWHEGKDPRFILIVDIWHPELTEEERKTLPAL